MARLPLLYHPGEAREYSVSVDIQGALIERLIGMSLADFMQTRILRASENDKYPKIAPDFGSVASTPIVSYWLYGAIGATKWPGQQASKM